VFVGNADSGSLDNSSTKEKCEYWRSYTASLLFQNPQLQESFDTVSNLLTEDLQSSLSALLSEPSRLPALKDILHSTVMIYVSLKCQRDVYEIEDDVKPGIDFDESRMDDIEFTQLDSQERGVVTCVLAKGWVRRSYRGSKDVVGRVCNARVTIRKIS
jgi:hypothetical protein